MESDYGHTGRQVYRKYANNHTNSIWKLKARIAVYYCTSCQSSLSLFQRSWYILIWVLLLATQCLFTLISYCITDLYLPPFGSFLCVYVIQVWLYKDLRGKTQQLNHEWVRRWPECWAGAVTKTGTFEVN